MKYFEVERLTMKKCDEKLTTSPAPLVPDALKARAMLAYMVKVKGCMEWCAITDKVLLWLDAQTKVEAEVGGTVLVDVDN